MTDSTSLILPMKAVAYLAAHHVQLESLKAMWLDPLVQCYDDTVFPDFERIHSLGSVFLAGPTSRHQLIEYNWRAEAVAYLREAGWQGYIHVPEPRGLEMKGDFTDRHYIHEWESSRLLTASHPTFWIPRKADELLGLNTNLELGIMLGMFRAAKRDISELYLGWPDDAERMGLPNHYAVELLGAKRYENLRDLCYAVANKPLIEGGEQ